jgi:predicted ribosome quality control (RQC) complex YloA/Tae2 family protein
MYFDMLTLAAVVQEIKTRVPEGRVQAVVQPDTLAIALEIYAQGKRWDLLLSAEASHPRVHFVSQKPRRGTETPSPLLLRLRKYLVGARLGEMLQPPWERILHLQFRQGADSYTLIAEIMGKHSNLVLTDESGRILECVKRVGQDVNRYRVVLPGRSYVPPPMQERRPLPDWQPDEFAQALLAVPTVSWDRTLVKLVRGLSPLAAREALARAGEPDPAAILVRLHKLFAPLGTGDWAPSVAVAEGNVAAYAPYLLTQFPEYREAGSISEAIEAYLAAQETVDPYAAARAAARDALAEGKRLLERRRTSLQRRLIPEQDIQALMEKGQILLAHSGEVRRGTREVTLPGLTDENIRIELDPRLTAVENAQRYFRAYQKARAARDEVPQMLEDLAADEAYLAQLETDLALASSRPEIDEVMAALVAGEYVRAPSSRPPPRTKTSRLLTFHSPDSFVIYVGHNSRQNEELTFKIASHDDIWLHARGVPGAHVIVRSGGRMVPPDTLEFAAQLAAHFSAARDAKMVPVDWTERKHVRRLPGGKPGMVHYDHERSLVVNPDVALEQQPGTP